MRALCPIVLAVVMVALLLPGCKKAALEPAEKASSSAEQQQLHDEIADLTREVQKLRDLVTTVKRQEPAAEVTFGIWSDQDVQAQVDWNVFRAFEQPFTHDLLRHETGDAVQVVKIDRTIDELAGKKLILDFRTVQPRNTTALWTPTSEYLEEANREIERNPYPGVHFATGVFR